MAETVEWIDPDGLSITLNVKFGTRGRFAPPTSFDEEGVPEQAGGRLNSVRHGIREFLLPLQFSSATAAELRTLVRSIVASMDPTRGAGKVRFTGPGGDQREINCRYASGLDLDEILGQTATATDQLASVVFRAHDPYYYDPSDTVTDYATGETAPFFPIFPLRLSSSEVFADATVDNIGDLETWPVWTIIGPGSSIALRNLSTNKLTQINSVTLTAGETITVDTRPTFKTVTKGDGTNLYPNLSSTSSLWPLVRGDNQVRVEMGGATATSSVRLSRKHRYLSP